MIASAVACRRNHIQGVLLPHQGEASLVNTEAVWRNWQTQWTQKPLPLRVKTGVPGAVAVP